MLTEEKNWQNHDFNHWWKNISVNHIVLFLYLLHICYCVHMLDGDRLTSKLCDVTFHYRLKNSWLPWMYVYLGESSSWRSSQLSPWTWKSTWHYSCCCSKESDRRWFESCWTCSSKNFCNILLFYKPRWCDNLHSEWCSVLLIWSSAGEVKIPYLLIFNAQTCAERMQVKKAA